MTDHITASPLTWPEGWKRTLLISPRRAPTREVIPMEDQTKGPETVEDEIQRKELSAQRVTPDMIDAAIDTDCAPNPIYHVFPTTTVTVCCLKLRNGYTVTGESACASPENFNAELGRRIALENAKQKIWALEGYLLRDRLANIP